MPRKTSMRSPVVLCVYAPSLAQSVKACALYYFDMIWDPSSFQRHDNDRFLNLWQSSLTSTVHRSQQRDSSYAPRLMRALQSELYERTRSKAVPMAGPRQPHCQEYVGSIIAASARALHDSIIRVMALSIAELRFNQHINHHVRQ